MCKTLSIGVKNNSNINYVDIYFKNGSDLESFCDALAEYIINKYETKLIYRTINNNFCYFNNYERRKIFNSILDQYGAAEHDYNLRERCHNIIKEKLFEYIAVSDKMILDGFVTFRLYEYVCELEKYVDKAVNEYLVQKEYEEFIELLRYFVDIQTPQENIVHIIAEPDSKYRVLNEDYKEITNDCIKEFLTEIAFGEINYDDLIISALITLAPKKIVLHNINLINNKQVVETIKKVFIKKVDVCEGCFHCGKPNLCYKH